MKEFLHARSRLAPNISGAWDKAKKPLNKINATLYLNIYTFIKT